MSKVQSSGFHFHFAKKSDDFTMTHLRVKPECLCLVYRVDGLVTNSQQIEIYPL